MPRVGLGSGDSTHQNSFYCDHPSLILGASTLTCELGRCWLRIPLTLVEELAASGAVNVAHFTTSVSTHQLICTGRCRDSVLYWAWHQRLTKHLVDEWYWYTKGSQTGKGSQEGTDFHWCQPLLGVCTCTTSGLPGVHLRWQPLLWATPLQFGAPRLSHVPPLKYFFLSV